MKIVKKKATKIARATFPVSRDVWQLLSEEARSSHYKSVDKFTERLVKDHLRQKRIVATVTK